MRKIPIYILVLAVLGLSWFWLRHPRTHEVEEPLAPIGKVETAVLQKTAIAQTIEAFGVVGSAPSGEITFVAPYEGIVRRINVSVSSAVIAGEVLIVLEPSPDEKYAFDSARSTLGYATQALDATQQRYDLKLATRQDLLTAQQAVEDARIKVGALEARGITGNQGIVARVDGVVSKLDLAVGARVALGTPLVTVSTGAHREVRLDVEAADLKSVAEGQPVALQSVNRTEARKITSSVRAVGAALDPVTGAAEVRVTVPPDAELLLGEHIRAAIVIRRKDQALVVPRSALLPDENSQVLFTVKDGKAVRHKVTTDLFSDDLIEVIGSDLHVGDEIVTQGNYELEDGMAVQVSGSETIQAPERKS